MMEIIHADIISLTKEHDILQDKVNTFKNPKEKKRAQQNLDRTEAALKAVRNLEKKLKPTFNEVDLQEYVDMMLILKKIETMQIKKDDRKRLGHISKLTNEEIKVISNLTTLFLGYEGTGTTLHDVSSSHFGHVKSLLCNSTQKIEGYNVTYSEFRALIKRVKIAIFELPPLKEKQDITVSFHHKDIGNHTPITLKRANHKFIISVTNTDGKVYDYGFEECFDNKFLSYKPYKFTLAEYIKSNPLSQRRKPLFDSQLLYPTRYAKGLIQGLLSAVVSRIENNNEHEYLVHPENILLHEPIHPPYPPCYFAHKIEQEEEKMLNAVNEKRQFIVPVSFVHRVCERKMKDIDAVEKLIFNTILEETSTNPLPQEWKLFKNGFGKKNEKLFLEKISSNYVLWDWPKQLGLLGHARALIIHPERALRDLISPALENMDIMNVDWCTVANNETPWELVFNYNPRTKFVNHDLELLLLFFRNLVEHIDLELQGYKTRAYLAYRIRCLFPSLLQQINEALIEKGLKY